MRIVQAKHIVTALLIAACLVGTGQAATAETPSAEPRGRAYLFRGLIGLIDWGMDELAQRINRSGVAANIGSHLAWREVANQAISDYRRNPKPISVIGHSIGGDAALEFAQALNAAHVPVSLLITYDPNRSAGRVPANVERYIDLYQSSNFLGGGDIAPGPGFHGHYASFNLKNRAEVIHVNMDKFEGIQKQLAAKIRTAGARGDGEAVPLHIVFPAIGPIELWELGPCRLSQCRRYAAKPCDDVSCPALGAGPDQSEVGECSADRRRAHRRSAPSRPESGAEPDGEFRAEPNVETRAVRTLICSTGLRQTLINYRTDHKRVRQKYLQ